MKLQGEISINGRKYARGSDVPWYRAYPLSRSVIPFLYFVLYTFLLRHALLDITGARDDEQKKQKVEYSYVVTSVLVSLLLYYLDHRQPHAAPGA